MTSTPLARTAGTRATGLRGRTWRTGIAAATVALTASAVAMLVPPAPAAALSAGDPAAPAVAGAGGTVLALPDTTHPGLRGPLPSLVPDAQGISAFVTAVYVDFLGRAPADPELAAWGSRIESGAMNTMDLTNAVSLSDEWITGVITRFYTDTLGRQPDPAGLAGWTAAARRGVPIAEIASGFYGSPEYFQSVGHGDHETWVRDLYRVLLEREPDPTGLAGWLAAIRRGTGLDQVALGFYQSPEKLARRVQALYQQLLGRSAEPGGVAGWSVVVAARGDLTLAANIAGSQEYWNRAQARFPGDGTAPPWVEVVGTGTPASCTTAALAAAVRDGGSVAFDCGPGPVTIELTQTLYTCNTTTCQHPWQGGTPVDSLVLDGGGLVTLSGGGARGIFYANSCQESFGWLTSRCDLETRPSVAFHDITFADGNAQGPPAGFADVGGGGAIAMRGGTLTVEDVTFVGNRTVGAHSDWGGGAVRVTGMTRPATFTRTTFTNNAGASGGALSSLHAPMVVTDSVFTGNVATGWGASDGLGGNGGAVYFDGTSQDVHIVRTQITGNVAPEGGPAVFYVSNTKSGTLTIEGSTFAGNSGQSFFTSPYRSIFYIGTSTLPVVSGSSIQ